eukprot:277726_1
MNYRITPFNGMPIQQTQPMQQYIIVNPMNSLQQSPIYLTPVQLPQLPRLPQQPLIQPIQQLMSQRPPQQFNRICDRPRIYPHPHRMNSVQMPSSMQSPTLNNSFIIITVPSQPQPTSSTNPPINNKYLFSNINNSQHPQKQRVVPIIPPVIR